MAVEPQRTPGVPGPSSNPIERTAGNDAVPLSWLTGPEFHSEGERVDRLAADVDLVTGLALGGYAGRDWEYFSTELAKYGIAVLGAWMRKGLILEKCRSRGFGGLPSVGRRFDPDEIEELTGETVTKALWHFRNDVLMKNRWDARRGASLRTFFIGQCLIRFNNIYRRWHGNELRNQLVGLDEDGLMRLPNASTGGQGTDQIALARHEVLTTLTHIKDRRVRRAMFLTALGLAQTEIALDLGVTEKAVERMLSNERSRLRKRAG